MQLTKIKEILMANTRDIFALFAAYPGQIFSDYQNYMIMIPNEIKIPALLMAHVDRVIPPKEIKIKRGRVTGTPGLGADDRAGVYTLWQLQDLGAPMLLTNYEESGGIGAEIFAEFLERQPAVKQQLQELNVIISFDRQGYNNFVRYSNQTNSIPEVMAKYGFSEEIGSWSDCLTIAESLEIAEVNISVGYYHQHSANEYWDLTQYKQMLSKYPAIIRDLAAEKRTMDTDPFMHYDYNIPSCPYCGEYIEPEWLEQDLLRVKGHILMDCPYCMKLVDVTEEVDRCDYLDYSYSYYF